MSELFAAAVGSKPDAIRYRHGDPELHPHGLPDGGAHWHTHAPPERDATFYRHAWSRDLAHPTADSPGDGQRDATG